MRHHVDTRRAFWGDIFDTPFGDINIVAIAPHVPIAWHRHQRQNDRIFVVRGKLRVRWWHENDGTFFNYTLREGETPLVIERGFWHGYEALRRGTIVLQFNGPGKWDGSDEERLSFDKVPWD